MDERVLCERLLRAGDESSLIDALSQVGLWHDAGSWRYFGDRENNFSTIGNQQASAEAALVEKLVNSVDAVLTLECRLRGIDPEGPAAPKTIKEAVARFFGIRDGNLAELTGKELTEHALRIGLVATGSKQAPNLTVFDTGEGQEPDHFPHTFLSIAESNKIRIPFVQGKFNMGGTGVLQFCGTQNIQLIVSRRHPALAPADQRWGFTVIRRERPTGNLKSSVYRYLAPGNQILRFQPDPINLELDGSALRGVPLPSLEWGSIIKLYEYQLPGGAKTNILLDLFNDINCLMPGAALPIRFYEKRNYSGHSFESTMIGLEARLDRDMADNLEFSPTFHTIMPDSLRIRAKIYVFKRRSDGGSASEKFRGSEGVLFTVNGQVHGQLDKNFFRRSRVGLSYIADDLLVLADTTQLDPALREDLFMNSRDRLRDNQMRRSIESSLEELLHDHDLLRELNNSRRSAALGKKLEEDTVLEEVLRTIVMRSPVLASLLVTGARIQDLRLRCPPARVDCRLKVSAFQHSLR